MGTKTIQQKLKAQLMNRLRSLLFWKKFTRFLLVGLSIFTLFAFFQYGRSSEVVLADYVCPASPGVASNLTANGNPTGFQFPAGTRSVTLSWNPASQAQAYSIIVRTPEGGRVVFSDENYTGTTLTVQNLVDGGFYHLSVIAKNNCGLSTTAAEARFSITASSVQNCANVQPIICGTGGEEYTNEVTVYPDPNNNCQTICPRDVVQPGNRAPVCTISAYPSNNISAGTNVTFTGNGIAYNGKSISTYQWDFDNNGVYETGASSSNTASATFNNPQTVRLRVVDTTGMSNDCTTYINIGNNYPAGSCATDRQMCSDGSSVGRNSDNACNFYACPSFVPAQQCSSVTCTQPQAGCYWQNQLTYSCDISRPATCGQLICPAQAPVVTIPQVPALSDGGIGDLQTQINEQIQKVTQSQVVNAVGGSSSASGGSSVVRIGN